MFAEPRSVIFSLVMQPSNAPPRRSQRLNGSALAFRTWSRPLLQPGQSPRPTRPQGSVGSPGKRCLTQPRCPRNQRSGLQKVSPLLWRDRSNKVGQMSKVNCIISPFNGSCIQLWLEVEIWQRICGHDYLLKDKTEQSSFLKSTTWQDTCIPTKKVTQRNGYHNLVSRLLLTLIWISDFFELVIWHSSLVKVTLLQLMNLILGHFQWGLLYISFVTLLTPKSETNRVSY